MSETPVNVAAEEAAQPTPEAAVAKVETEELVIPDVIERLPKPDKAAHEAEIGKLDAAIKKLQARSQVIRTELDALKSGRGGFGEQIQAAKAVYAQIRAQKDNLIQERNQITARLRQTRDEKDSTLKTQRDLRANLKFGSEEEFDAEIASLRDQQQTRSMSLMEEKRIIKEIEALQAQKKKVGAFAGEKGVVDMHNQSIKEIRELQTQKNLEIDAVQEKLVAQKAVLDELYRKNDEEKKNDQFPVLAKERREIKEQLDDKFTALKALRKEFKEANNKYYDNIRLVRKKKELERQKEEEGRKAEYQAKLAEYEKEMAKIHPFQDEMDLCDAIVSFLEKTYAKELREEDSKTAEAAKAAAPVELDGMKPLQRKEEDYMMMGTGGKKGKKGKHGKKSKKEAKLVLPLSQVEAFSSVGLMPPSTVSAVAESLAAVKAKKTWFNEQTSRPKADEPAEKAAASPVKTAEPKKKSSNKNKKFNAGDKEAFPSLGGVAAAVPAWGPGIGASAVSTEEEFPAVAAEFATADVVTESE